MKIDELKNRLVVMLQGYFSGKYIFKRKSQKGVFISWSSLSQKAANSPLAAISSSCLAAAFITAAFADWQPQADCQQVSNEKLLEFNNSI